MSRMIAAALFSGIFATAAVGATTDQAGKEKNITDNVRAISAKERMLPSPDVQLDRLAKGLKLTAEQQKQIRPVLADEYARVNAIRQDDSLTPKQIQARVAEIRNETALKMQEVMTPEQKAEHDTVRKEIKELKQKRIKENRKNRLAVQQNEEPVRKQ